MNQPEKGRLLVQVTCIFLGILSLVSFAASKFTNGKVTVILTALGFLGFVVTLTILAFQTKGFWRFIRLVVISLGAVIFGTYGVLFVFLTFFQDTVVNQTSAFFQPKALPAEAAQSLTAPDILPLDLPTPDGVQLRGWLVKNSNEAVAPLVIFFNGSGSESSELIPYARNLKGWSVALVNYRGFGQSEGTPSQANALADALTMGYSLGTGVAVYLSEHRPTNATILVSPYDRWTLIGLKHPPLYAPLESLLKPYLDSISRAGGIRTPMLSLIGSEDTFVPPDLSQNLADAWSGEVKVLVYPGEDHNLLFHENNSWSDILTFLDGLVQP